MGASSSARFGRVVTAMVTPFTGDGALDLDGAQALACYLVEHGNDGLVVTGTTGEGPALSDTERIELWAAVRKAVSVPVLAGATTSDTAHSIELVRHAEKAGVDGILAVTPYYSRPSQAGIEAHFREIAHATELPVLLYDIPVRTGRKIATETMLSLSRIDNVVGVKDAAGDPAATARLLRDAPSSFCCYSGEDLLTLPLLSVGAVGVIGVATHWVANEAGAMIDAYFSGDVARACELNRLMLSSFTFETSEAFPNPMPTKAVLRALGLPAGQCRLPLGPAEPVLDEAARALLSALEDERRKGA